MQRFIAVRETFHSSVLGRSLDGGILTDERLRALSTGLAPGASGIEDSQGQAIATLGG